MKRAWAGFAAALVLMIPALLAGLPEAAARGGASCAGVMACCAQHASSCERSQAACPSHAAASGAPCVRPLGCGHSLPGVTLPSLDPVTLERSGVATAQPPASVAATTPTSAPDPFHTEPPAPPPRA